MGCFVFCFFGFFAAVGKGGDCKMVLVDSILSPCECFGKTLVEVVSGECLVPLLLRH